MNRIGIDQIIEIGWNDTIDPKELICSICYCININAKECFNKKCKKIFCGNCMNPKNKILYKNNKFNCPFCRISSDMTNIEERLKNKILQLKYFCSFNICILKYNFEEYLIHSEEEHKVNNCNKCKQSGKPLGKCGICMNNGCIVNSSCDYLAKCFNCKLYICLTCNNFSNGNKRYNILCGICSVQCKLCNNKEAKEICGMCNKFLCQNCGLKCEHCNMFCCSDVASLCYLKYQNCLKCNNIPFNEFYNKCKHLNFLNCEDCYPKCGRILKIGENTVKCDNVSNGICKICKNTRICVKNCSIKCKSCKELVCSQCYKICPLCKVACCLDCLKKCSKCDGVNSYSCNDCNIDTIRPCNKKGCDKKLCLSCWNVCNYCNIIHCEEHSFNCVNCEDKMCSQHYHTCNLCNTPEEVKFKKLCLSKCTNQCSFCTNITNSLCKKKFHLNNMVETLNCVHNVCGRCLKKCYRCEKIVVSCPKCIVNYYFHHCKICDIYLCNLCSKYCNKCEDIHCTMYNNHKCFCCNKSSNVLDCLNCNLIERLKCLNCGDKINHCNDCSKVYICSVSCYLNFKKVAGKSTGHICNMFLCGEECSIKVVTNNKLAEFEFNKESKIQNKEEKEKVNKNIGENKVKSKGSSTTEKTKIGCSSCIVY